jgi:hypothetical protein
LSTKENVEFIKQELNSEEKFIESFIKVERFYKKNKIAIIAVAILLVGSIIGYNVKNYLDQQALVESNVAYNKLLVNPEDKESLKILESKNKNLYELYTLSTGIKNSDKDALAKVSTSKNAIIADIAKYELSSTNMKPSEYNGKIYKDISLYQQAYALTKESKFKDAKIKLDMIATDSPIYSMSNLLKHYLITKMDK